MTAGKDANMSGEERSGAEIDKLAAAAERVNIVEEVHELQGAFVEFFRREEAAYHAAAGDGWSDAGLAAWIKGREAEMQACWRADIDVIMSGGGPK
jgi:hypothetical protein